jgi:hypothetical protein
VRDMHFITNLAESLKGGQILLVEKAVLARDLLVDWMFKLLGSGPTEVELGPSSPIILLLTVSLREVLLATGSTVRIMNSPTSVIAEYVAMGARIWKKRKSWNAKENGRQGNVQRQLKAKP